jgi:methionyl aminopeptidase
MILIKDREAIDRMAEVGGALAEVFDAVASLCVEGCSTLELDAFIAQELKQKNMTSMTKGYMGYDHVSCISLNDEVVHGVPSKHKKLCLGDLVKIDICVSRQGYCADMARPFFVGALSTSDTRWSFVETARRALDKGIGKACVGNRLTDISFAIQSEIEAAGYGVVRDFAGHGIGQRMHEDPEVLNYGRPGRGPALKAGMVLAIEPMLTMGSYEVYVADDGWTAKTVDGSLAMHIEDTVAITEDGPRILTRDSAREALMVCGEMV